MKGGLGQEYHEELPYLKQLKGKIVRRAISKKKAFAIELPKYPQYIINGDKITEEQALEIIRRTDNFFIEEQYITWDCFEKQVCEICKIPHKKEDTFYRLHDIFKKKWKCLDDFYYFVNDWIYCNSGSAGYHGWCHPDGTIGYCNHGYIKYPSVGNFHHELKILGNHFPFLHLCCIIMNNGEGEATESIITLELKNGVVTCLEPIPFERLPIRGIKYGDHSSQCHTCFSLDQIQKWADQVYNRRRDTMMKKVICFHNPNEENGYLSNWWLSTFTVNDVTYTSAEQYIMHQKALLFHDTKIAEDIMKTNDVAKIKAYGRKVKNYDDTIWNSKRKEIVYQGLLAKFQQNEDLSKELLSTGEALLAECAVKDRIWGIGLSMKDERRFNPNEWQGQNLLGQCLMEVRNQLREH